MPQLVRAQVGAAISKLISASIGDLVVVMSKSPAHKHYSLADIEWPSCEARKASGVLPPVLAGQFYLAEATNPETGFRAPIAAVTWARVSPEVDAKLRANVGKPIRLWSDEWTSGDIHWLIDLVGDPRGLNSALKVLLAGPFKDKVNVLVRDSTGAATIENLQALAASTAQGAPG